MHDNTTFSCCCAKSDCPRLQEFYDSFKRVENDAHLAAEVGQVLLQEKNGELQYDLFKDNYDEIKQLRWENEQSNEMIRLLKSEIKSITSTSNDLRKTIEKHEQEIQKKKLVEQLLAVKTDIEEELKTQISDLKQELSQLRKSENNMIIKYKRLDSNYETLQLTHEALSQEHDKLIQSFLSKEYYNNEGIKEEKVMKKKQAITIHTAAALPSLPSSESKCPSENSVIPEPMSNKMKRQVPQFHMAVTNSNKNPFDVLHSVTQQTFDKISATDTRVLNRRLRRVFDMSELSDMSNSIISGILMDLSEFKNQFEWVHDYYDQEDSTNAAVEYFFPLVRSIQDLLEEVGTMKMTLNDLQADYVKRIERLTRTPLLSSYQLQHPSYVQPKYIASSHPIQQQPYHYYNENNFNPRTAIENEKKSFMQGLLALFTLH